MKCTGQGALIYYDSQQTNCFSFYSKIAVTEPASPKPLNKNVMAVRKVRREACFIGSVLPVGCWDQKPCRPADVMNANTEKIVLQRLGEIRCGT